MDTGANPTTSALKACQNGLITVFVVSLVVNLLMLTTPLFMLQVFDRVLISHSRETLIFLLLLALFALVILAVLDALRGLLLVKVSDWLEARLAPDLLNDAVATRLRTGEASVQGLRDLTTFRQFMCGSGITSLFDAPWTPIFLLTLYLLHPLLGGFALVGTIALVVLGWVNDQVTARPLQESNAAARKALSVAESGVRNAEVVEAMGLGPGLSAMWWKAQAKALALQGSTSNLGGVIASLSRFIRMALQVGILALGAFLALTAEITPGVMIAGSILMGRALAPVEGSISTWRSALAARNAYDRVCDRLALAPRTTMQTQMPKAEGRLSIDGLILAYPGQAAPVLKGISLNLEPGTFLGVIGPTASGKTTLARAIVGTLAGQRGTVRLDGVNMVEWQAAERGPQVGYLPQDIELFEGTIKSNIARLQDGDDESVVKAARLGGCHEMILSLPQGYETEIGDGGAILSGGQRQRIGLARALYGDPALLVLDEPNASLDTDGERALVEALQALKKTGATVVLIAHRPATLRNADMIVVMRDGAIVQRGTPRELMPSVAGADGKSGVREQEAAS